jgi:undecaprenyl diphosphate synthase
LSERKLLEKIDRANLPKHIAVIMDGNGRWAKKRHLPRISGHRAGMKSVRNTVEGCREIGIEVLTLYAFSTENWRRPKVEVNLLMKLLCQYLRVELDRLRKNNIKLTVIGDIHKLPGYVRREVSHVVGLTSNNDKMILNLALNYGARQEIIDAVKKLLNRADMDRIDETALSKYLYTCNLPDPDLLIRTSGELRISNFLLWQIAYTELYFTDTLWPDFTKTHLYEAILNYQQRKRRYGGL